MSKEEIAELEKLHRSLRDKRHVERPDSKVLLDLSKGQFDLPAGVV